jgi:hypothetical protein
MSSTAARTFGFLLALMFAGQAGTVRAQNGAPTDPNAIFYMPIPANGPMLASGEKPQTVWVRCLATADHHLSACVIEDAVSMSDLTRRRLLDWAVHQPPWTRPDAKLGETVRLRVATPGNALAIPPVPRSASSDLLRAQRTRHISCVVLKVPTLIQCQVLDRQHASPEHLASIESMASAHLTAQLEATLVRRPVKAGDIYALTFVEPLSGPPIGDAPAFDFGAIGQCGWNALGVDGQHTLITVYETASGDSPFTRSDALQTFAKTRADWNGPLFTCLTPGSAHLPEATAALWMHILSEVAAAKLSEIHISKYELDAALNKTPSVRDPIRQMAIAVLDHTPGPSAIEWDNVYKPLGISNTGTSVHPRTFIVDYYFGRAMEAEVTARVSSK